MRARVIIGGLLIAGAIGQAGLAWHLTRISSENARVAELAWEKADTGCREAVGRVGTLTEEGVQLRVDRVIRPGEDWRVALMDASSVISHCSTRRMIYFCMGRACEPPAGVAPAPLTLEEQQLAPSPKEVILTEPVRMSFRLQEVKQSR